MNKFIVYCTTNLANGKIYIGVHETKDPEIFDGYIGNGINIFKANTELKYPKLPFHKAVKKYGYSSFKRATLKVFNTLLDALDLERWLVTELFIKQADNYNATIGGGMPPKSTKNVYQYDLDGNFIKGYESISVAASQFTDSDGSQISWAAIHNTKSFEYLWSFEKKEKLDVSNYNNKLQRTPIYEYDLNGDFVREYNSMSECCKNYDCHLSVILRSIKSGKPAFKRNFSKYKHDKYIIDPTSITKKAHKRSVLQYTMDGLFVKEFDTVREARAEFPNVGKVLNGQAKHCHNFIFKYKEVNDIV